MVTPSYATALYELGVKDVLQEETERLPKETEEEEKCHLLNGKMEKFTKIEGNSKSVLTFLQNEGSSLNLICLKSSLF